MAWLHGRGDSSKVVYHIMSYEYYLCCSSLMVKTPTLAAETGAGSLLHKLRPPIKRTTGIFNCAPQKNPPCARRSQSSTGPYYAAVRLKMGAAANDGTRSTISAPGSSLMEKQYYSKSGPRGDGNFVKQGSLRC